MASGLRVPHSKIMTTFTGDLIWYFCGIFFFISKSLLRLEFSSLFPNRLLVAPTASFCHSDESRLLSRTQLLGLAFDGRAGPRLPPPPPSLQVTEGEPGVMWLSGLHIPESYLTALVQATCRRNDWPLDRSTLFTQVTKFQDADEVSERAGQGEGNA